MAFILTYGRRKVLTIIAVMVALIVLLWATLVQPVAVRAMVSESPAILSATHYSTSHGDRFSLSCGVSTVSVLHYTNHYWNNPTTSKRLCISEGLNYRLAMGSIYDGSFYVSIGQDSKFYRIDSKIDGIPYYIHRHTGKDMVALSTTGPTGGMEVSLYESLLDIIEWQPRRDYLSAEDYLYKIDKVKMLEKRLFKTPEIAPLGWGLSPDGRHITYMSVVGDISQPILQTEINVAGVFDGSVQEIGTEYISMWPELEPLISVSNNGSSVVVATLQRMILYESIGTCVGDEVISSCGRREYPIDLNPGIHTLFLQEQMPNEDFSEITYLMQGGNNYAQVVVSPMGGGRLRSLDYLALGDSYSSGEGDVADGGAYYLPGTKLPGQCHLSSRSYPFILRDWWQVEYSRMTSVACSGAQILRDYVTQPTQYRGQDDQLMDLSTEQVRAERVAAIDLKKPGIVEQIGFVKKYKPKVVTLTGGGNDVGFADVLNYCATGASTILIPDTCTYAQEGSFTQRVLKQSIDNQYRTMMQLIGEIRAASPETKIYVVGYPQFVATNLFCSLNVALLDQHERRMVRDMTSRLNDVLSRAADDAGVAFVDIEDALEGGQLCQGSEYVSGLYDMGIRKVYDEYTQEMFHPNAAGHSKMAHAIFNHIPSIAAHVGTSARSGAKSSEEYLSTPVSRQDTVMKSTIDPKTLQVIQAPGATFQPNSSVLVTMFSEPTEFGSFVTGDDGGLTVDITLPDTITPGCHTLVLEGVTYSGEPITLYQFVTVTSGAPSDIDGDGIPDEQDQCNFITKWIDEKTGVDVCSYAGLQDDGDVIEGVEGDTNARTRGLPQERSAVLQGWDTQPAFIPTSYTSLGLEPDPKASLTAGRLVESDTKSETSSTIVWIAGAIVILGAAIVIELVARRRKYE